MYEEGKAVFRAACWVVAIRIVSAGISCLSNPCLHGICIDDINSTYSCYCVDGYTGVQCQTNWDECWSNPCQNGGTCIDGVASYNCSCRDGFIGDNCETNYNECESNPCLNNGTCIDMTNGYVCSCIPGFSGEHCELDIAVCNSTEEVRCYNGGECIEGPGFKFYCKCLPGWAGPKCEDQIDECQSNPCQNGGVCIDVHADYMCACPFGYTGKSCEVQIEFCDENSCSNNALCVVEDSVRVCYCVPDYHGERCELQYDECLLGPRCMNGGTCIDGVDNFTCSCPPRLTGTLCECLIIDNNTLDCDYVSPTTFTLPTKKPFITTLVYEDTTYDMTTGYSVIYTDSIPRTPTTEIEKPMTSISIVTTEQVIPFTEVSLSTKESTGVGTTETITTVKETSEVYDKSTVTMANDNSIADTTKQCTDCHETSSPPIPTRVETTATSTVSAESTTTTTTTTPTTRETTEMSTFTTESTITTEIITTPGDVTMEVATTVKSDTTTERMFTDAPTDQPVTDFPLPIPLTTEPTEATSVGMTTSQSECTDTLCSNHGTCVNSPHGFQCHCTFNYAGKFCEEKISVTSAAFGGHSYIAHKLRNTTSVVVAFNAKTLITDGQIMHIDIAKDVYTQLFLNGGLLKFKFSCGYQTMLLSELKTFVNKGYPMRIETRLDLYIQEQHCNATLRLNDTVAMSGGQVANITSLDYNATLYLGNAPNTRDAETKPFIGCIKDLEVNGEAREIFGDAVEAGEVTECVSLSCLSSPCFNGGSCKDNNGGYACSCSNGWFGEQCNRSACEHNPCQAGGSCVRHPGSGFLCLCPYGKHGIFCEYNVEITRPSLSPISPGISSYLVYPLSPSAVNSERFDLRLRFQTTDMDQIALLAFVGQYGHHDSRSQHLALTFVKGYIMLTWNMGSGARRVFTSRALPYRRGGHTVRVWRRGRAAGLSVDARLNASGNAPARRDNMQLLPYLYIGGHPSEGFHDLPHDLPLHSGWRGCIWEVGGQAAGGRVAGGRGAGQCGVAQCTAKSCNAPRGVCIHSPATYGCICNEGWYGATCSSDKNPCDRSVTQCRGQCVVTADDRPHCDCPYGKTGLNCDQVLLPTDVLFTGTRSYIGLHPRPVTSVSLSLEAEVKPTKERGLLVFIETPHFYTVLSLQGGLLEYRWTDRVSGLTSLVRSGVVLSMSQWHSVKAGRYGSRLYVWVDGALSTEAMLAHAYPHTAANASILLGGAKDLSTLPFDAMSGPPEFYTGCLRNFHLNNILLTLEQQNIQEGQNVADCDGTACGGEACGGAACVLESGAARCACAGPGAGGAGNGAGGAGQGAGARCRRHAGCSRAACVSPRGHCRGDVCVCAAGYAGVHCERQINITIPQFEGDSFLSLSRNPARPASEQRLSPATAPGYISLNFTTAELNGLLLWITMDSDYIGIGLEEGYIKIVWNFHNLTKHSVKYEMYPKPRTLSREVPYAGFLADAEWHTLVLKLDGNISLTVDKLSYIEEPRLNFIAQYEQIDVYIGGITEENTPSAKKLFPSNFKGCIDQISTNEKTHISNYTEFYSENVRSCQLLPPT